MALTLYHVTASFPRDETHWFGISDSSGGIFNPVEYSRRLRSRRRCRIIPLLYYRQSSASELEYQLLLARDLKLISPNDYEHLSQQTVEIKRMLTVLVQKLNAES